MSASESMLTKMIKTQTISLRYVYNEAYSPKTVRDQSAELEELFPQLNLSSLEETRFSLPEGAESWFVIPRWEAIADTYHGALMRVFRTLSERRSVRNHRERKIDPQHIRPKEGWSFIRRPMDENHDTYLLPAQFGLRHRSRSAEEMEASLYPHEFPLNAFEVAIMLLVHPERIAHVNDLWVACAGDECDDNDTTSSFDSCLYFYCACGPLEIGAHWNREGRERIGFPTGFSIPA